MADLAATGHTVDDLDWRTGAGSWAGCAARYPLVDLPADLSYAVRWLYDHAQLPPRRRRG